MQHKCYHPPTARQSNKCARNKMWEKNEKQEAQSSHCQQLCFSKQCSQVVMQMTVLHLEVIFASQQNLRFVGL
eukprot:4049401-Ditylum_brightwellii.AAC.1